jgi:putative MFS transporter
MDRADADSRARYASDADVANRFLLPEPESPLPPPPEDEVVAAAAAADAGAPPEGRSERAESDPPPASQYEPDVAAADEVEFPEMSIRGHNPEDAAAVDAFGEAFADSAEDILREDGAERRAAAGTSTVTSSFLGRDADLDSVDEVLRRIPFGRFYWRIFFVCAFANFAMGVETAVVSVLYPTLQEMWDLTRRDMQYLNTATYSGLMLGALSMGHAADRMGRKPVFQATLVLAATFGLLSAFAPSMEYFAAMRFFMALGFSGNLVVDQVILSEFLPVKQRGRLMVLLDLSFAIGVLACVLFSWLVVSGYGWSFVIGFSALPALLAVFLRIMLPESPQWYLIRHESDRAVRVLQDAAQQNRAPYELQKRIGELRLRHRDVEVGSERVGTGLDKLFGELLLPTTFSLVLLWLFCSLAGTIFLWLPVYMYEHEMLNNKHELLHSSFTTALYMVIGDIIGGVVLVLIVQLIDRRIIFRLLLIATAAVAVGIGFLSKTPDNIISLLPVIGAIRSATVAMLYTYTPELLPTAVRGTGLGLMSAIHRVAPLIANWIVTFLIHASFLQVSAAYAIIAVLGFATTFLLPYDTRDAEIGDRYYAEVAEQAGAAEATLGDPAEPSRERAMASGLV